MTQWLTKHVIRTHKQCAVESPQSRDRPTTMLYYVHQTLFFPRPHTKERKGPGYARLAQEVSAYIDKKIFHTYSSVISYVITKNLQ